MQLLPTFEIYGEGSDQKGSFQHIEIDQDIEDRFMEADELYVIDMKVEKPKTLLKKLISDAPFYTESYFLLAEIARNQNKPREAAAILEKGVKKFKELIPSGFEGEVPWGFHENRPFLQLLHELLLTYDQQKKTNEAVDTGVQILSYNPDDNQGIRWLMGDLCLKNENLTEAAKFLKQNAGQYPPNRYSYALLLFKQNKRWDAVTHFRLAFLENIYISEMIRAKAPLTPYEIFEPSNLNGLDVAGDYFFSMKEYWFKNMEAMQLMDLIITHPDVYDEINSVFGLYHEIHTLPYYDDYFGSFDDSETDMDLKEMSRETRAEIFEEIDKIKKNINTSSSKKILKELDDILLGS